MLPLIFCADGMWVSINRAVFLCDECSSIHRRLGKHISYIRCLDGNNWPPKQLEVSVEFK